MKTILFATDFSETCDNAFEYLKEFVEGTDLVVSIINVFDLPVTSPTSITTPSYSNWVKRKKDRLTKDLEVLMDKLPIQNRGAIEAIYGMLPATDISKEVSAYDPDLVVMGLRAKHSIVDKMVGTVTAQTIKKIKTPVLAIPYGAKYTGFDHILFPTNLSSPTSMFIDEESSLNHLLDLGNIFDNTKVEMLNIQQTKTSNESVDVSYKDQPIKGMNYIISEASTIEEGIVNSINDKSINLIVVQKSKSNFWSKIFSSSVTRKLMFKVKVPIVVFQ